MALLTISEEMSKPAPKYLSAY